MQWGIPLLRTNITRALGQRKLDLLQECLDQIREMPVPNKLEDLIMQNIVRQEWWSVWLALHQQMLMMEAQFSRLPTLPGVLETNVY